MTKKLPDKHIQIIHDILITRQKKKHNEKWCNLATACTVPRRTVEWNVGTVSWPHCGAAGQSPASPGGAALPGYRHRPCRPVHRPCRPVQRSCRP